MITIVLQNIGAVLALMVGLNGLFRPLHMGKLVGLAPETKVGLIEIRVLFGCFLTTLPLILLFKQDAQFFTFFGYAALAAAIIKSAFTVIDQCPIKAIRVGIAVDVILAALLLSPLYLQ